jgi:hypothetical protein
VPVSVKCSVEPTTADGVGMVAALPLAVNLNRLGELMRALPSSLLSITAPLPMVML